MKILVMQSRDRGRTPSVYGRLLDEDKFTGVYKERFNDFHRGVATLQKRISQNLWMKCIQRICIK